MNISNVVNIPSSYATSEGGGESLPKEICREGGGVVSPLPPPDFAPGDTISFL